MIFIGIGKNYVDQLADKPELLPNPTIFTKPEHSALHNNQDFKYPSISEQVEYELELAFRIGLEGKQITKSQAWNHIDAVTLAIDFTAKDVLSTSREKKGPWALAKGFDGATPLSAFQPISNFSDPSHIHFSLSLNGNTVQKGDSRLMIHSVPDIVSYVSQYITLKPGDVLLTGTPAHGKGFVKQGDRLVGHLQDELIMDFSII